jgi:hypothetical protein
MERSHFRQEPMQDRKVYFLICWNEQDQTGKTKNWQFKLEIPGSRQPLLFNSLEEVMDMIDIELNSDQKEA